jgi:hypothetical protein
MYTASNSKERRTKRRSKRWKGDMFWTPKPSELEWAVEVLLLAALVGWLFQNARFCTP